MTMAVPTTLRTASGNTHVPGLNRHPPESITLVTERKCTSSIRSQRRLLRSSREPVMVSPTLSRSLALPSLSGVMQESEMK